MLEGVPPGADAAGGGLLQRSLALFTGMALGRHKLAPLVSPHKTVEGAWRRLAGGMAGMAIFCLVYRAITGVNLACPCAWPWACWGAAGELGT